MLKFLVTGAAGQLGKDVVRELENRGYEVTGSGSKKRKTAGRYVKMDITDRNEVEAVMKKLRPDIVIHCAAWTAVDAAVDELEAALDGIFNDKDNTYTIINMESMTDAMNLMTSMMMSLLVGIASIALVVGGIGIMNMMLVTVTERTTEIGLRKALGAEPGQIQMQFLIEAIILSLLGGVIGVIVGLSVSFAICMNTDITFSLNTFAIGLGVGFSAAVGIIFGWAPARKASRLNPIDALRSM